MAKRQISIKLTTLMGIVILIVVLAIAVKAGYNYIVKDGSDDSAKEVLGSNEKKNEEAKEETRVAEDSSVDTIVGITIFIEDGKPYYKSEEEIYELEFNVGEEQPPRVKKVKILSVTEDETQEVFFITENGELWVTNTANIVDDGNTLLDYFYPYYEYKIDDILIRERLPYEAYQVFYPVVSLTIILKDGTTVDTDTYEMFGLLDEGR